MQYIYHSEAGKEASPVCLVFIHGMLCDHSNWALQIKYFSAQYKVIALDLPGHGESSAKFDQQWDVTNLALEIKDFLLGLKLKRPLVIVAHSASVRIALELNYLLSQNIAGLVLLDCGYQATINPDIKLLSMALRQKGYALWLTEFFSRKFGPGTQAQRDTILQAALKIDPKIGEALYLGAKIYDYYALEKCLRLTTVPVLVLQSSFYFKGKLQLGTSAADVQSEWIDLIKSTLPKAQIRTLLQCGHWLMLQQPEACNQAIEQFVHGLSYDSLNTP